MDKEKLLKKYIFAFTVQTVCACSYWFLLLSRKELNINSLYLMPILLLLFLSSVYVDKKSRAVMPMILSIHDTVEKFEKQNSVLYTIFWGCAAISAYLVWTIDGILSNILPSLIFIILPFINVNNKRISYLKKKPEGLNF